MERCGDGRNLDRYMDKVHKIKASNSIVVGALFGRFGIKLIFINQTGN